MILQVCSVEAAKEFVEKLPADDKRIALYEVCNQLGFFFAVLRRSNRVQPKGGYHELQNEPEGVKEKFVDECVEWAEAHFPTAGDATQAKL